MLHVKSVKPAAAVAQCLNISGVTRYRAVQPFLPNSTRYCAFAGLPAPCSFNTAVVDL